MESEAATAFLMTLQKATAESPMLPRGLPFSWPNNPSAEPAMLREEDPLHIGSRGQAEGREA